MRTQERFTQAVQAIADDAGLDLAVDTTYSNVGTYRFYPEGTFKPKFAMSFQFNSGYASFHELDETGEPFRDRNGHLVRSYCKVHEMDDVLDAVRDRLLPRIVS